MESIFTRRTRRLPLATLLFALLALTVGADQGPPFCCDCQPCSDPLPFATLDQGAYSGYEVTEATLLTFFDAESFADFWHAHAFGAPVPSVDFDQEMVIALLDYRSAACDGALEIMEIAPCQTDLQVSYRVTFEDSAEECGAGCDAESRPFHIVTLQRRDEEIVPDGTTDIICSEEGGRG